LSTVSVIRRHPVGAVVGAGAVVLVGAFLLIYFVVFSTSSPKKLALTTNGQPVSIQPSQLAGTWTIAPGSVVGYRVREKLGALPAQDDAVGRTSQVSGMVTLKNSGGAITASGANFTANVATLSSDQARRDNYIRTHALQTDQFGTATFTQTGNIAIPASAEQGQKAQVSASGNLTIHGVTKQVTIPLDVQITGNHIQVVGSTQFPFSEFGMTPPSIGGFVSVESNATLEFSLLLAHS
jgi:polyisoprenoid-binding protein YceI